jgi:choline dehydrogenase-like flavoprotein
MEFPVHQVLRADGFQSDETLTCDVVIIGSGAGGAAAAWHLTEAGLSVLILEEGRKWEPKELSTKQTWAVRNLYAERGTSVALGNIIVPMPRGRAVGGSTLINSAICFRTPNWVMDNWNKNFGIEWANREKLNPLFETVEQALGVSDTPDFAAGEHNRIFKKGVDALGLKGAPIRRNAPGCVGCGLCYLGCPIGGKGSVDRNLIPRALEKNAALLTCARVEKILIENGTAVGVEAYGVEPLTETVLKKITVRAKKVFLCGGAISSPTMLLRQKIGNSSGHVGNNLHVHTAMGVCARFEQTIDAWHGASQGYFVDLENEPAVLETFNATPGIYSVQAEDYRHHLRNVASCGNMIGDTASGTVRPGKTTSRSELTYEMNEEDLRVIKKGARQISQIYFAAGAQDVHLGIAGIPALKTMEEVDKVLKEAPISAMSIYASHPMSTCRMSADKKQGVIGPNGESWDVKNLVIADASAMCTSLAVNPQITIMTVASQIAKMQLAKG